MAVKYDAIPMRVQPAEERVKNFEEVALGYTEEEALLEASRCLQCKNSPCRQGCPVQIDIPAFIKAITEKDYEKAIAIIHEADSLPCVTGRVCPQENQCQQKCVVGIKGEAVSIGRLERFVADLDLEKRLKALDTNETEVKPNKKEAEGEKVAVIGSGPAGISCAADLVKLGYNVTVFEGFHKLGGVLVYGIPEFRLPNATVEADILRLQEQGVTYMTDALIGRVMTIDELLEEGYKAVFVGTGAGLPRFMDIPGENLNGVYSANEFLTRVNLMKAYKYPEYETPVKRGKNVAVIGGGNVAMDAARTALRLGADNVYLIYRRTEAEMPARREEVEHAMEEGVVFKTLTNPVAYHGNEAGFIEKVECVQMELGEADDSGRRRPVLVDDSNFTIDIDVAIIAIGTTPNPLIAKTTPKLETGRSGVIAVNEDLMTSIPGVFAGGDIVSGAATVITAMGAGRKAAEAMDKYIKSRSAQEIGSV